MFDERMRLVKDNVFNPLARPLQLVSPWWFSIVGLVIGVLAGVVLWQQMYVWGFVLWFLNRVFDGLDGAVARRQKTQSDFGGYLDIVVDFVVYVSIPVGLALGVNTPAVTMSLVFLLCTYYVNSASWMYLAAILEKRQAGNQQRLTTVTMPAGIIGGVETILFYTFFIFFPAILVWSFTLMGLLIIITIIQRLVWARRHLI